MSKSKCRLCSEDPNFGYTKKNCRRTVCKACEDHYGQIPTNRTVSNWINDLLKDARRRAEQRDVEFSLTHQDIFDILPYDLKCPILGTLLKSGGYTEGEWKNSPTMDRIIPEEGYVVGNIQIISGLANAMKSQASPDELLTFARWVSNNY